jgi:hypothetical protein
MRTGAHHLELPVRLPGLVVHLLEGGGGRGAGIVEEDIDPSPLRDHRVDQTLAIGGPAHVGGVGEHLPLVALRISSAA